MLSWNIESIFRELKINLKEVYLKLMEIKENEKLLKKWPDKWD
jgi:hypothetical protein